MNVKNIRLQVIAGTVYHQSTGSNYATKIACRIDFSNAGMDFHLFSVSKVQTIKIGFTSDSSRKWHKHSWDTQR